MIDVLRHLDGRVTTMRLSLRKSQHESNSTKDTHAALRHKMVHEQIQNRGIHNPHVLEVMRKVPRHQFVEPAFLGQAYEDRALPIDCNQTISQPYIVAFMISALAVRRSDKVLEVGTGTGYQTALLAELAGYVVSVERLQSLAESAENRLTKLGYSNVNVVLADEKLGWRREAPYDAIIVAAAAPKLVRTFMDLREDGGRLMIPVGSLENQQLIRVTRSGETFAVDTMGACRFVPLIGDDAWSEDDVKNHS